MSKYLAESVLGANVTIQQSQAFGANPRQKEISNCLYNALTNGVSSSITFTIRSDASANTSADASKNTSDRFIATMKQEFGERYEIKKIANLGDSAIWDSSLKQLSVFQGNNTFVWVSTGATSSDIESKLISLAQKTLH
jgi:hypothetical protein